MHDYIIAAILVAPSTISALGSWASNRRTHRCLNDHIEQTADHHANGHQPR